MACAVFELPVCYATATAELFALGAVSFLDQLGVVDYLCFGSECNDLDGLTKIADILCDEPDEYTKFLKENLRAGMSFPAARQDALSSYMGISDCSFLLSDPNNILGIEYLKALRRVKSRIQPFTIKQHGIQTTTIRRCALLTVRLLLSVLSLHTRVLYSRHSRLPERLSKIHHFPVF